MAVSDSRHRQHWVTAGGLIAQPIVSTVVLALVVVIAILIGVTATIGAFSGAGDGRSFETARGEIVEIRGGGVYAYDSVLVGSGNVGVDVVNLAITLPALVVFALAYRRGSVRAALLLYGVLGYIAYVYAGRTLGSAYNDLFLAYVAVFSASLFAMCQLLGSLRQRGLFEGADLPRRSIAGVVLAVAGVTLVLWLETPITALLRSSTPATLDHYTTLYTHGLDLAIIVPLLFVAGIQMLLGRAGAYLTAFPVIFLIAMLAPALTASTLSQVNAGVPITAAQMAAYVVSFVLLGLAALWVVWRLVRAVPSLGAATRER